MVSLSDSDYVDCVDDKKSTFCYIFMMVEGDVSWKSVIASSTVEAKYVACYEAICHEI